MLFTFTKKQLLRLMKTREFGNIFYSFAFRIGAILCNFLIVPLLIDQINTVEYGVLITIISISTWFTFVDFGLANGLKNKISESLAKGELANVRKYIVAGYFALLKVVVILSAILLVVNFFVDWNQVLKGPTELSKSINTVFFYGLLLFLFRLVAELINPILYAYHKASTASFISFVVQFAILALCYLYKLNGVHSFAQYGLLFFWIPLIVYSACNFYFYSTLLKAVRPAKSHFDPGFQKDLFKLGGSFFIIQIAYLIVFATDNLIVGRIFGYSEVSKYNIAFRYFNIPILVISIILTPYWPLFSGYYYNKEMNRIKKIMRKLITLWALVTVVALVMLMAAPFVYLIWLGEDIKIEFVLNLGMFFFCIISGWSSVFATFINSTSKLKLQTYSAVITGLINIPVSVLLATKTNLGTSGVIFGTCICVLFGSLWAPIQYKKLINQKASGIWNE
jgi:O-antigen/teichoic acid export membrane protein